MVIFAVLVRTPISSSLFPPSPSAEFSKYEVNLALTTFDTKKVRTITTDANIRFKSNSVEKKLSIRFVFAFHCSSSFAQAENVAGDQNIAWSQYRKATVLNLFIKERLLLNIGIY